MSYPDIRKTIDTLRDSVPWYVPNGLARKNLNISEGTRKNDSHLLASLGIIRKPKRRKGYTAQEFIALSVFRQLQANSDRDTAIAAIIQHSEDFKNAC